MLEVSEAQRQGLCGWNSTVLGTGIAKKTKNIALDIIWASTLMTGAKWAIKALDK